MPRRNHQKLKNFVAWKKSPDPLTSRRSLLFPPSGSLVSISPFLLHISESLLDFLDCFGITSVLPCIIADLDRRSIARGGKLDDDVQRNRLLTIGFVDEII